MSKKKPTSFVLSDSIQKIKDELTPIYGLKNILSAGLLLFSHLSDSEQKKIVAEVNKVNKSGQQTKEADTPQENIQKLKNILKTAESIRLLSPEESKLADDIRQALGPKPSKQKKKAKKRG